ncbi:DUF1127 domain-containing protein [Pelagibius sp. 7325]|uniref:DUF1127 domain-containing protein n=1 Tax=Pelagibius sp. 7325 TaxID=3131994 RepID=UPI0030ED17A3
MFLAVSRSPLAQGDSVLADALYRLTGLGWFSPQARARRARYERTLSELGRMDDRELSELGLRRCDIRRIARENAFYA